jgi:hypothetical protein
MRLNKRILSVAMGVGAMAALAGCASDERGMGLPSVSTPSVPPKITLDQMVGKWGIGAYHKDTERARTLPQARAACSNPYVITKGPNGGVMMHVADSAELFELKLKVAPDGRTFVGPDGPPGDLWDREILAYEQDIITTRFSDPEVVQRYGTMVFVRCK